MGLLSPTCCGAPGCEAQLRSPSDGAWLDVGEVIACGRARHDSRPSPSHRPLHALRRELWTCSPSHYRAAKAAVLAELSPQPSLVLSQPSFGLAAALGLGLSAGGGGSRAAADSVAALRELLAVTSRGRHVALPDLLQRLLARLGPSVAAANAAGTIGDGDPELEC